MPPVKESNAVHWVQDDLHALFTAQLPATMDRRILEHQSHAMIIPMTIGIKMKLRVVTCRRQQSWSGLV